MNKMSIFRKCVVVAGTMLGISVSAKAAEIVWKGPSSGQAEWAAPENWEGGVMPGANDCAVFGEGIGTLTIVNTTTTDKTLYFKDFKVQSGTITFAKSANTKYMLNSATNLFTIASEAKVIWECATSISANNIISIHVAGGGTWQGPKYNGEKLGNSGWGRYVREVRAKVGSTVTFPGHSSLIRRYVAEKDASLTISAISSLHGTETLEAEKGGTINVWNENGNNAIGAICGEGTINFLSSSKNYSVGTVGGPNTFSGVLNHQGSGVTSFSDTVDEAANRLTVGGADSFANVSTLNLKETRLDFKPGIGTFSFGKLQSAASNPVVAEDLDGRPVELRTKGLGETTFLSGSGSWYNTAESTITGRQIRVAGKVSSTAALGFGEDAALIGNEVQLSAGASLAASGRLLLSGPGTDVYGSQSTTLNQNRDALLTLPLKQGVYFTAAGAGSSLVVESNAVLRLTSANQAVLPSFTLRDGGVLCLMRRDYGWASSGNESSYVADVDGGVIELCNYSMPYTANLISAADAANWTCRIGPGGLTFRARGVQSMLYNVDWQMPSVALAGEDSDGGITIDGSGVLAVAKPQRLAGPITLRDGGVSVGDEAVTASDGAPLGTGDLVFDSGRLVSSTPYAGVRQFATGTGSSVRLRGAGSLSVTGQAQVGALTREKGGVLFIDAATLDGENTAIKVLSGVSVDANGRSHVPVIYNKDLTTLQFVKYDAAKGFVPFAEGDYTSGLDGGASSISIVKQSTSVSVPVDAVRRVMALKVQKDTEYSTSSSISLAAGAKLKVGDGTNPAVVLLASNGGSAGHQFNAVTGAGALDFGTSEGVVVMPKRSNVSLTPVATISARISGANGVTFAGVPSTENASSSPLLTLSGDNDFTGGATVENTMVDAASATAFGANAVTVRGGHWHGATVSFSIAGGAYANNFTIRGNGFYVLNRRTASEVNFGGIAAGALWFSAPGVKLTGDIVIDEYARISSMFNAEGSAAEIAGVVSGGKLQVVNSREIPIAFSGANTYTGGTQVVSSKIVLRDGTLGTGLIELDNSTLRFENAAETVLPNAIRGNGVLEFAGEGVVSFAGDVSEYAPTAVDLCGGRRVFAELPAFMTRITNSSARRATLALAENLGTVFWEGRALVGETEFDLEVGEGTLLDLGGATLTVRRALEGSAKRVINGALVELKPKAGLICIFK